MATAPRDAEPRPGARRIYYRQVLESPIAGPVITLVTVFVLFFILVPSFRRAEAWAGIVNAATLTGIITIGVTQLMIAGEFDLSVGPMMAWGAYLFGFYDPARILSHPGARRGAVRAVGVGRPERPYL